MFTPEFLIQDLNSESAHGRGAGGKASLGNKGQNLINMLLEATLHMLTFFLNLLFCKIGDIVTKRGFLFCVLFMFPVSLAFISLD